jgi:hypothetical protein
MVDKMERHWVSEVGWAGSVDRRREVMEPVLSETVGIQLRGKLLVIQIILDMKPIIVINPVVSDCRSILPRGAFSERWNFDVFDEPCQ